MNKAQILDFPAVQAVRYDLLLDTLRQLALTGQDSQQAAQILSQDDPLDHFDPQQLLAWASCAQIVGHDRATRAALHRLQTAYPEVEEGWLEHYQYLSTLNDQKGLVALKAACRLQAPQFLNHFQEIQISTPPTELVPDEPFAAMRRQAHLVSQFMGIFYGREDCFARQWVDKAEGKSGYTPVRRAMTEADVRDHLTGTRTYGIYLMQIDGLVRLGVIDVDLRKDLRQTRITASQRSTLRRELAYLLERLPALALEQGLRCIIEFSGFKGYHFWFPFAEAVEAKPVRGALQTLVRTIASDLTCFGLEVFPKQDTLSGKGLGNLVKLPLGLHRLSGKPSRFLPGDRGDVWHQLAKLDQVQSNPVEILAQVQQKAVAPVIDHPDYVRWKQDYADLGVLSEACPLLAGIFALCREGRTLSVREERVLYGVVGFLDQRKALLHSLLGPQSDYNPHLVDYRLSRLRGTPLGCKKIHALLESTRDYCIFPGQVRYQHPLLFVKGWTHGNLEHRETVSNLQDALDQLRQSLEVVARFLPVPKMEV